MRPVNEKLAADLLEAGKQEFLEKGYTDASLRTIAAKAETTTGSIYTRFGDKEGLFRAIADPVVDGIMQLFCETQEKFHMMDEETQKNTVQRYSSDSMDMMLDYIYGNFDTFRLLLEAPAGTKYFNFLDEMVRIEVEYTYKYMDVIGCESVKSGAVTEDFLHMVSTAYFEGVFEVVRHNMSKEEAVKYINMLKTYHMVGFDTIFSPEKYAL